jgi:hypothetical protein
MILKPRILWYHLRNATAYGYSSGIIYKMPLWLTQEAPDFMYGVVRQQEELWVYALESKNNIRTLLQESKDEFVHKPAPELLPKPQGGNTIQGARKQALANLL